MTKALISPRAPFVMLGLLAVVAVLLLAVPLKLPIGPNYWDVYLFLDVAHRIDLGQIPHRDFFIPIGALPFYLHDLVHLAFPKAQPVLAVQYAVLLVALPLMWLTTHDITKQSPLIAVGYVAPFALFALMPLNIIEFYPSPGIDGFGIYNRQASLLLYPLVGALLLARDARIIAVVAAVAMTALVYLKVTAGLAAALMIGWAFVAGRISFAGAGFAALFLAGVTVVLELFTGLPGGYLDDLRGLAEGNAGGWLQRLLTFVSLKFDVIGGIGLLVAFALVVLAGSLRTELSQIFAASSLVERIERLRGFAGHPAFTLAVFTAISILYETQNTGSLEFIYLWPAIMPLASLLSLVATPGLKIAMTVLVAAAALPSLTKTLHRAARIVAVAPGYDAPAASLDGPLGAFLAKPVHHERAKVLASHYSEEPEVWLALARSGHKPSAIQYSEPDYQIFHVLAVREAIEALKAYESANGVRFASTYVLDFVDPVTPELDRRPPKFVSVAVDPYRTFPEHSRERALAEVAGIEAILIPRCPITPARLQIEEVFKPVLEGRNLVQLSPCWTLSLRNPQRIVVGMDR